MHVRNTSDRTADDHELEGNYVLMGVVLRLKEPKGRQARDDECEYQHCPPGATLFRSPLPKHPFVPFESSDRPYCCSAAHDSTAPAKQCKAANVTAHQVNQSENEAE
jgi:hypothetical protein